MSGTGLALALSFGAGLATTIGAVLVLAFPARIGESELAFSSGMACGVMFMISVFDMLTPAFAVVGFSSIPAFTSGALSFIAIERAYSKFESDILSYTGLPKDVVSLGEFDPTHSKTLRSAVLTALVLTLHNLPEGLAVMVSSLDSTQRGLSMAIAVALHNIPEGLAIATPLYATTKDPITTLLWTTVSGMSEPFGALITVSVFGSTISPYTIHLILSYVGGVMLAVSFLELLPTGLSYKSNRDSLTKGLITGILIISVNLCFFT